MKLKWSVDRRYFCKKKFNFCSNQNENKPKVTFQTNKFQVDSCQQVVETFFLRIKKHHNHVPISIGCPNVIWTKSVVSCEIKWFFSKIRTYQLWTASLWAHRPPKAKKTLFTSLKLFQWQILYFNWWKCKFLWF